MDGTLIAFKTLGDALAAYQARIAELESLVVTQQAQIAELEAAKGDHHEP